MLAAFRSRRARWSRRILATFTVGWLTLLLQPCAMALGVEDHDCPHCPPAERPPCDTQLESDCAWDDRLTLEPRGGALKLKDLPVELPVAILPPLPQIERPVTRADLLPAEALRFSAAGPPLNVLFCVYLK